MSIERVYQEEIEDQDLLAQHVARYRFAKKFVNNSVVVDFACGSGYGSSILLEGEPRKVIGIDISQSAINYAKSHFHSSLLEYHKGSVVLLSAMRDINIVVSFETIEHLENYASFLEAVFRALSSDGTFIVSTPVRLKGTLEDKPKNPYHIREWNSKEFIELISGYFKHIEIYHQYIYTKKWYPGSRTIARWRAEQINPEIASKLACYEVMETVPSLGKISFTPAYIIAVCKK
ncbi:MAG: class I SAM-dependent methyltransferase [Bacteroidetes bacterium]|nr:MAG: class I SAM-dependent methyltransferase [Bacteroidota bacterium]